MSLAGKVAQRRRAINRLVAQRPPQERDDSTYAAQFLDSIDAEHVGERTGGEQARTGLAGDLEFHVEQRRLIATEERSEHTPPLLIGLMLPRPREAADQQRIA